MAVYRSNVLTKLGKDLLTRSLSNSEKIEFTGVKFGKGIASGDVEDLTGVVDEFKNLPITSSEKLDNGGYRIRVSYNNSGLTMDTYLKEVGVYAKGADGIEILYSYCSTATPDLIPAENAGVISRVEDINTYISNATNIAAVIDQSAVYATIKDLIAVLDLTTINKDIIESLIPGFGKNNFLVDRISDFSVVNTGYSSDDGTRFYVMPKAKVKTGTGGAIKIFGDNFLQDGTNYRDFGLYFSQNQKEDVGTHGSGVFWLNSKVNGSYYPVSPIANGKWPDIGISFQDGSKTPARWVFDQPSDACFMWGYANDKPSTDGSNCYAINNNKADVFMEGNHAVVQKLTGKKGYSGDLAWQLRYDTGLGGNIFSSNFDWKYYNGTKQIANISETEVWFDAPFRNKPYTYSLSTQNIINGANANVFKLESSSTVSILNAVNCLEGQEITLIFLNENTTINNGGGSNQPFILEGSINFTGGTGDILTLVCINDKLYEKSRSVK